MHRTHLLRTCRFRPYRLGGPTFTLRMWATKRNRRIAYELTQHENGRSSVVFSGEDFSYADDSDQAVFALMEFLTLRLAVYQREDYSRHAGALLAECCIRIRGRET